jgi:hypothetical protein
VQQLLQGFPGNAGVLYGVNDYDTFAEGHGKREASA